MKTHTRFCLWIICYAGLMSSTSGQSTPELRYWEGSIWLTGLQTNSTIEDQWKVTFLVYTQEAFDKKINQTIAGSYNRVGDSVSFTPYFRFVERGRYHAVYNNLELSFSIPEKIWKTTIIESVHPEVDVLPENTLRMYISFSGPMMPGEAYDHIKLLAEDGTPVEKPFLIIDQELWDADRKRFTLLFDPGRVKRGIQSNVELGAPLKAGKKYQLVIDSAWRDVRGNSLTTTYIKSFTVSHAKRTKLSITEWKIVAPASGTSEALQIYMDRPIDYALALNSIMIMKSEKKVTGATLFKGSNLWLFTPDQPWAEDEYQLKVYSHLEDVAGNNFNNVFDIDLSRQNRQNSTELVQRSFFVRSLVK